MIVIVIHIRVKPGTETAFAEATLENARNSIREPGIVRFDFLREESDPTRFVLVEAYLDEAAVKAHKETAHFARWKEAAEPMMAEERRRTRYEGLFVPDRL